MGKFKIGLDFDDVLIASVSHSLALHNAKYGTHLTSDHWYDDPSNVEPWGVKDFSEVISRIGEIHSDPDFLNVQSLPGALRVLKKLKKAGHELIVVTGRPSQLLEPTQAVLRKQFAGILDESQLYFTDHFAHEGPRASKGDIAVELGLTYFIDDVIQHADEVASKGVKTILFGGDNYHWNQGEPAAGVTRLANWKEIGEYFDGEAGR